MRDALDELLQSERPTLLAYLRRIGRPADAEDAFQEVALRALRLGAESARDPRAWLYGIARNVARIPVAHPIPGPRCDPLDPHGEAERMVVRELLTHSLRAVPPELQALLVEHHAFGASLAEIAAREGLGENTLAARLSRARRRIVADLPPEARETLITFGIPVSTRIETSLWCPLCADAKLERQVGAHLDLVCPRCPEAVFIAEGQISQSFQGSPRVALNRLLTLTHAVARQWQASRPLPCPHCLSRHGHRARAQNGRLTSLCRSCGLETSHNASEVALAHPEVRQFWKTHGRIAAIQSRESIAFVSRPTSQTFILPLCPTTQLPLHRS